ncbi:fungal-specific transcription factor domain-containing protein [Cladorrhinum sp. PSN332]|nr:fungal-specific transcription factor domain-containing protein [Cladorrhinum sp. PSN332]
MDAADVFRQGLGSLAPRAPQTQLFYYPRPAPVRYQYHRGTYPREEADNDAPHRIAHTLTACCRCRQRKTRCDASLPRCTPCDRAGSVCEYFDTARGRKMNRSYVVDLQKKVRMLEEELSHFTEEEGEYPHSFEDMMRPGGMVRLEKSDETPRYLGPSSGIAMTRLLMEEAKRFTESQRISDLVPKLNDRRRAQRDRMQSVVMGSVSGPSGKRYPQNSDLPAPRFPDRQVVDKFVQAYHEKVQVFAPVLHEQAFSQDIDDVFAGDQDPYKLFAVNMVLAISIQKMGRYYQGLAKSYFLSAMQHFEDVIRPKDLKTLQCLILTAQYSLLTPTRVAIYYVIGLATRICQQLGLGDERTIGLGVEDAQTLDMRRRLSWIVTTQEYGLAHIMGRPSGFAKCNDFMNVKFFEAVADSDITPEATPESIRQAPTCQKKLVAIHFCKMRLLQAEIRRVLYEKKRDEPTHDGHPWFAEMEQKMKNWLDDCPAQPPWCKPWFTGRYMTMVIFLYRPSFQVPKPSSEAAIKCFDGAEFIINLSSKQVETGAVDLTWVFVITIYTALNSLLWSVSYPQVRAKHDQSEVEQLVERGLDTITNIQCQCAEDQQWAGVDSTVELYNVLSKACLHSYSAKHDSLIPTATFNTPLPFNDHSSPESEVSSQHGQQPSSATSFFGQQASPFGYVVESYNTFDGGSPFTHQPAFRSNSIFGSTSVDPFGRRLSQLAPDSIQGNAASTGSRLGDSQPPMSAVSHPDLTPPQLATTAINTLPTPPESLAPNSEKPGNMSLSPRLPMADPRSASPTPTRMFHDQNSPAPTVLHHSGHGLPTSQHPSPASTPTLLIKSEPADYPPHSSSMAQQVQVCMPPPASRTPAFTIPTPMRGPSPHAQQQRPGVVHHWHQPPPPFIQPHAFTNNSAKGNNFWNDGHLDPFSGGLGLSNGSDGSYTLGGGHSPGNRSHLNGGSLPQPPPQQPPTGQMPLPQGTLGVPGVQFPWEGFGGQYLGGRVGRNGSVTHAEQLEMISELEANEGLTDIDTYLNLGMGALNGVDGDATLHWN